ncbi:MAG: carboxylating nicotinate-nucleotide diphosphorylase [Gammaproteobacteria bacterium]|nr:carboxylating nicotinate-nucleotide diphosphorylase [Gammaproteobacteria bacterium]
MLKFDRSSTAIDFFADLEVSVANALVEDIGAGDRTAHLIHPTRTATASVIVREPAVLCGIRWFDQVFNSLDSTTGITWKFADGDRLKAGDLICEIAGNARVLVTGERTALNFLQSLSGTATVTAHYVEKLASASTRLLDTRKTIPGLRRAQKYAVKCGGGYNHRAGLYDGILVKENHIAAAGSISAAIQALRSGEAGIAIEVEVERLDQVEEAIAAGADMLLLDNFDLQQMATAVVQAAGRVPLEASGGFELDNLPAVAATGVDFVSIGALTKHVRAIDYSMRIVSL